MKTKTIKPSLDKKIFIKKPKMYKVIFFNDDFTPFSFVEKILVIIFNKTEAEANEIANKIHTDGSAVVGVYIHEIAHTKQAQTLFNARQNGFPLYCDIEPEDSET